MLWFTVWLVLVLATLGGAFVVLRRLWRALVALGHEVTRAGDVAAQLADRAAELEAVARAAQQESVPALGADADALRERVEQLRGVRRAQRVERRARRRTTVAEATTRWYG